MIGVSVTRFRLEGGSCLGVDTDAGAFDAPVVVDAAGAWAALDPRAAVPVQPVRGQIVQLREQGEPLPALVCSEEVYLVPRADGTVLLGSTVEHVGFRKDVTAGAVRTLLAAAARLVPSIADARFETAWAGLRPGTPDGFPILGASPIPGLFFATGHFRNGILLAPLTARLVADAISGAPARELSAFSVERFAWAPALA